MRKDPAQQLVSLNAKMKQSRTYLSRAYESETKDRQQQVRRLALCSIAPKATLASINYISRNPVSLVTENLLQNKGRGFNTAGQSMHLRLKKGIEQNKVLFPLFRKTGRMFDDKLITDKFL